MSACVLRRGFKTMAERLSIEVREELQLASTDLLDPRVLAKHLGIPVVGLGDLRRNGARAAAISHFHEAASDALSAFTVIEGRRRLIVVNDVHSPVRRSSSLMHELAHVILEHEPHAGVMENGCRRWNAEMEEEANWLAGALLVPRDGALMAARNRVPLVSAAHHFGVSEQMMRWRLQQTGAELQARRERGRIGASQVASR